MRMTILFEKKIHKFFSSTLLFSQIYYYLIESSMYNHINSLILTNNCLFYQNAFFQ